MVRLREIFVLKRVLQKKELEKHYSRGLLGGMKE